MLLPSYVCSGNSGSVTDKTHNLSDTTYNNEAYFLFRRIVHWCLCVHMWAFVYKGLG